MRRKIIVCVACGLLLLSILCGCGEENLGEPVTVYKDVYTKEAFETVKVEKGQIDPTLTLVLTPAEVSKVNLQVAEENLEVEEINVNVGDKVTKGQLLVSFKSDDLKKEIQRLSDEYQKKQILLDHYTRLQNLEIKKKNKESYDLEIQQLTEEVELARLYLEEAQARFQKCQLVATENGTITYVNNALVGGVVSTSTTLITEECGSGFYYVSTDDDYEFHVGDEFDAVADNIVCKFKVVEVGFNDNVLEQEITFAPVGDVSLTGLEKPTVVINKPVMEDVVYVKNIAINRTLDSTFVYVVREDGYIDSVFVEVGDQVGDVTIIKSGLNGTEEVALK